MDLPHKKLFFGSDRLIHAGGSSPKCQFSQTVLSLPSRAGHLELLPPIRDPPRRRMPRQLLPESQSGDLQ